eukprot:5618018-Ditylum_brightwellii.AAC.1
MDWYGQIKPANLVANGGTTTNPWISPNQLMHTLHTLMTAYSMRQMERCHTPPSRSSPLPSMQYKGQDGSRMELEHGRQGIW